MWKILTFFLYQSLLLSFSIAFYNQEKCASDFFRETAYEINSLQKQKYYYLYRKSFKGTVVNRALSSLHGGSLEITFTVPLICLSLILVLIFILSQVSSSCLHDRTSCPCEIFFSVRILITVPPPSPPTHLFTRFVTLQG